MMHVPLGRLAIRNTPIVLVAALLVSGCAWLPWWPGMTPEVKDPFSLDIRIGRLGVILDQGYAAKSILLGEEPHSPMSVLPDDASLEDTLKAQYLALYLAVLGHNALQAEACSHGLLGDEICAKHFVPMWFVPPAKARVSLARIDQWSAEAQDAMLPVWARLCDRAIAKTGNEYQCAIE